MEGDEAISHGYSDSDFGDLMRSLFGGANGDGTAGYGKDGDMFAQSIMEYARLPYKEGYMDIELIKEAQTGSEEGLSSLVVLPLGLHSQGTRFESSSFLSPTPFCRRAMQPLEVEPTSSGT